MYQDMGAILFEAFSHKNHEPNEPLSLEEPCLGHFTVAAENGLGYWKIKHLASNETKFISRSFPGLQNAAVSRHRFGVSRHRCGS